MALRLIGVVGFAFAAVVALLIVTAVLLQAGRQFDGVVAWFNAG